MRQLFLYWRMTRPGFLLVTPVACCIGLATAHASGVGLSAPLALLTMLLATLLHAAANVLNDYEDDRNGADAANHNALSPFTGGARLIQTQVVSPAQTLQLARLLLGAVLAGGMCLLITMLLTQASLGLLWLGLAGAFLAWSYSAPPLKLMTRGIGELAVAAAWWLMVVGSDFVQRGQFAALPFAAGFSYALLMANILLINGVPDAISDAQVGKRTLVVRLGVRRAALAYAALAVLAHAWVLLAVLKSGLPQAALWSLLAAPLSLAASVLLLQRAQTPSRLRPAIVLTIVATVLHGVLMSLALWQA